MSHRLITPSAALTASLALAGAIFALDLITPPGLAVWVLYLLPLLLAYQWGRPAHLYVTMAVCTVLVLGLSFAMPGTELAMAIASRLLGLTALWLLTGCLAVHMRREARLSQSEDKLSLTKYMTMFDAAPIGISITDSAGQIVETNRHAERILNLPQAEHQSRTLTSPEWELLRADGSPLPHAEHPAARALTERRRIDDVEVGFVRGPGDIAWLSVTAAPVDVPGYGVLMVFHEVTERKRIQQALVESEERLRYALESTSEGLWDWDLSTGRVEYSDSWLAALGYERSATEPTIAFWKHIVHPDDRDAMQRLLDEHFAGHTQIYSCEARLRCGNGEYRYYLDRGRVVTRDAAGRPLRMIGADTDISERKAMEEALRRSEDRLSRVLNGSNDGWWDWEIATDHVYYSPRNWGMIGYAPNEVSITDDAWRDFMHPEDSLRFAALLEQLLPSRRRSFRFEARIRHRDGHYVPILMHGYVTRDAAGNAVMVSGANTDLTELKAAEDALRYLNGELEARVSARTAELAAALAKLERADKIKEEFLAAVSHELRTPLTGVLSIAEALELQLAGPLNERQLRHVRMLTQSGERLLAMIDNVLHYTNLISGRFAPRPVACHLADIGGLALCAVQSQAQQKHIQADLKVVPAGATLVTDREALLRMLTHLLENAVKFTPDNGSIGLEISAGAEGSAQFVVWDTGIGIAPAQQEHILELFTQADSSLARRFEGIGIGLAYVRRMVETLGGAFQLESAPNAGSRFVITLPAAAPPTALQPVATILEA